MENRQVVLLHGLARTSRSMRPMEKYLIKNGFTVLNINYPSRKKPIEELSEWVRDKLNVDNPPLTARGREQAALLGKWAAGEHFDEVYVSPLVRTQETAAPILASLGMDLVTDPWLEEIRNPIWHGTPEEKAIELWMKDSLPNANKEESYSLTVSANAIKVESATPHGLYNAIQTFKQLSEGNVISGCEIYDSPAFSWRGFMIDVGRNYQSISQIKQQIDVMAAYKLNIFHFHLTEV